MGSNMYTNDVVGNCNGNGVHAHAQQQGVIMSGGFMGKDQRQQPLSHFSSTVDRDGLSPLQNSTATSSSTSSPPSSSPAPQSSATTAKPNDIEQVEDGPINDDPENCSSMDHQHPAGARNLRIAGPPVPDPAQISPQHPHPLLQQQQHVHPLPSLHPQHYQPSSSSSHHPSILSSAVAMGLVDHGGYQLDSQIFRTPTVVEYGVPSHYQHSLPTPAEIAVVGPELSPPSAGKVGGKRRPRKRQKVKTCGVCGDRAKSFHFGGLSCDSCKAFFRRSVQHDAYLAFRCAYENCCDINISTRKSCQYCRFAKSLSIGMEKGWVMTEEERNTLNQQRLEKKHGKTASGTSAQPQPIQPQPSPLSNVPPPLPEIPAAVTFSPKAPAEPIYKFTSSAIPAAAIKEPVALAFQESEYVADVDKMLDYMSFDEQLEIKSVVETYLHAYKEMPFRVSLEEGQRDTLEIIEMFTTILRRFAYFAKLIPDFAALCREDQGNLLRAAVLEMCLLRGAACFDTEHNRWPSSTMEFLKDCPQLRVEDMQRLVSRELFDMHITFIFHMKRLRIDEPTAMLLIMTVLFSPERIPVEDKVKINQGQEKYLMLLKKYVNWKFGPAAGSRIYPQLLTKLSDLRQLNDFHTEFHLNLDKQEVNAIRNSLMELQLNPYPNWKIVTESQHSSPEDTRATSPVLPTPPPVLPTPSPLLPLSSPSMPMVTQALIRSFTDRRIPALLDDPYAVFETDLGMLRQVQETLGSLFPNSPAAAFTTANTQNKITQLHQNTESESVNTPSFSLHEQILRSDKAACSTSIPMNPRGYVITADSAEVQPLEFLHASHSQEYPVLNMRDSTTLPTATLSESSLTTLLPGEYHSERLQQFLQHSRSSTGFEIEGVIRGVGIASSSSSSPTTPSATFIPGSQLPVTPPTVLRKHSSSRSSLPTAAPSSVIRTAPSSKPSALSSLIPSVGVIQTLTDDSPTKGKVGQAFRAIITGGPVAGWHGGQVHATTTNGHPEPITPPSPITVTSRIKSTSSYSDANDKFSRKSN